MSDQERLAKRGDLAGSESVRVSSRTEGDDGLAAARTSRAGIRRQFGVASPAPGKRTLVQARYSAVPAGQAARPSIADRIMTTAAEGVQGASDELPYLDRIQESFGGHDLQGVKAQVAGPAAAASEAIGAEAYATGNQVAFRGAPDLHTAAHEAAHVVQQRQGVQLKGGVGQAGDAYEQQADRVADAVVQGKSAEPLLGGFSGSGSTTVGAGRSFAVNPGTARTAPAAQLKEDVSGKAKDAGETVAANNANNSNGNAEKTEQPANAKGAANIVAANIVAANKNNNDMVGNMTKCVERYNWLCEAQKEGVNDLKTHSGEKDPPSLAMTLLKVACEVAIAGGLGAVGKLVEIGIEAQLAKEVAGKLTVSTTGKAIAKSIGDGAKELGKQLVGAQVQSKAADKDAFWSSQMEALRETGMRQQDMFIDREPELWAAPDGPAQAAAMFKSLDATVAQAKQIQYIKSLDEWANCIAMDDLGGDFRGDPYAVKALGDISEKGVLGIEIGVEEPGSKPWVKKAVIEGLNSRLREKIKSRPLRDIHITKNIQTELWGSEFNFALQPSGEIAWRSISAKAGEWLEKRAKVGGAYGAIEGARLLVEEDMKDLQLFDLEG